ncbi:hypothetical protein CK203_075347 [Vitis vinifera]|uniref:Uncharacterized protein n=1 Tax=Vitis vinifera TaxID=29760 RepID=A0A438BXM2_VITVI|nr:hypothetical protein CK203_075347 [Vitis vinifera]
MRVFKFLFGLNKNLDEVRAPILGTKPLPSIQEACFENSALATHGSNQSAYDNKQKKNGNPGVIIAINLGIRRTVAGKYMANQRIGNLVAHPEKGQGLAASSGEKKEQQTSNNSTFFSKERVEIIQKPITQATSSQSTLTRSSVHSS